MAGRSLHRVRAARRALSAPASMSGAAPAPITATITLSVAISVCTWWRSKRIWRASWPLIPPLRVSITIRSGSTATTAGEARKRSESSRKRPAARTPSRSRAAASSERAIRSRPWTARLLRAMSSDSISSELALVDCSERNARLTSGSSRLADRAVPQVQQCRLGQAAAELVRARDHQVGTLGERVGGQVGVKPEVRPPCLVDDEDRAAGVRDLDKRAHVGHRAEVAGRDHIGRDRVRMLIQRARERLRAQAVSGPQLGVDLRRGEVPVQPAEHHPVHDTGVHAALRDNVLAEVAQRQARDEVALRATVGEQPRAVRAPRLGRQLRRRLQRRRPEPLVDAAHQRRHIQTKHALPEHISELRLRHRITAVPGHVQPDKRPARVRTHRVRVRSRRLGRRRRRRSRRRSAHDTPIVRTPQQATDAPVTTMIISRAGQQRRCRRTRRRRVQPRRASASAKRSAARPSSSRSRRRLRR